MLHQSGVNHGFQVCHGYFPRRPSHGVDEKLQPDGAKGTPSTEFVEEPRFFIWDL